MCIFSCELCALCCVCGACAQPPWSGAWRTARGVQHDADESAHRVMPGSRMGTVGPRGLIITTQYCQNCFVSLLSPPSLHRSVLISLHESNMCVYIGNLPRDAGPPPQPVFISQRTLLCTAASLLIYPVFPRNNSMYSYTKSP